MFSNFDKKIFFLLLFPPIIGILAIGFNFLEIKQNITNTTQIASFEKIEQLSNIVHHLQLERGITTRFVASNNREFAHELAKQRANSDESLQKILQNKSDNLQIVSTISKNITIMRQNIDYAQITKEEIFLQYSDIINNLFEQYLQIMYQSEISHIKNEFWNHYWLIISKENLAQLRAKITMLIRYNEKKQNMIVSAIGNLELFNKSLAIFKTISSTNTINVFNKYFEQNLYDEILEIANHIVTNNKTDIDSSFWFDTSSLLVDNLHFIESKNLVLIQDLMNKYTNSLYTKLIYWIIGIFLGIVLLALVYTILLKDKFRNQLETNIQTQKAFFEKSKMDAMNDTISLIAHQWRQPLSIISVKASGAKLQKELLGLSDEELYEALDSIADETQKLSKTIDDFRNFFKPETEPVWFDMEQSIQKILAILRESLQEKNIAISTNLTSIHTKSLETQIYQVLMNITKNAIEAVCKKQPTYNRFIQIDLLNVDENIVIKILDNGGGIEASIKDKIFDPYFTTKHQSQGTGLGLYVAQEILKKYLYGKVKVTNIELNNSIGTCFEITLPIIPKES